MEGSSAGMLMLLLTYLTVSCADYELKMPDINQKDSEGKVPWSPQEEQELMRLLHDEVHHANTFGDTQMSWARIGQYFRRSVDEVRIKFDQLQSQVEQAYRQTAGVNGLLPSQPHDYENQYQPGMAHQRGDMIGYAQPTPSPGEMAAYMQQNLGYYHDPSQYPDLHDHAAYLPDQHQYLPSYYPHQMHHQHVEQEQGDGIPKKSTAPKNDKGFWKEEEQLELLHLVRNTQYREQVTGRKEIDWGLIAKHLGRGKRSVQRKYDNLKSATVGADGSLVLPPNDGKKWSPSEVDDLMKLGDPDDSSYRKELLGIDKVDWRKFGEYFGRSYESVAYKYSYVKNTAVTNRGKRKHEKAKHSTSYKEMAITALQTLGGEGTSGQICNIISSHPVFCTQLDSAIVSGKKTLKRWKHGVRSALNAFEMFQKTGDTCEGEVVWRLDEASVQADLTSLRTKSGKIKTNPARKMPVKKKPTKKKGESSTGVVTIRDEEGASEILAHMAQAKTGTLQAPAAANTSEDPNSNPSNAGYNNTNNNVNEGLFNQVPIMQQILESNPTAEQLSQLPPEHLAMLQRQLENGQVMQQYSVPYESHRRGQVEQNPQHGVYDVAPPQNYPVYDQYDQQQMMEQYASAVNHDAAQHAAMSQGVQMGQPFDSGMQMNPLRQPGPPYDYAMYMPYGAYMAHQYEGSHGVPPPEQQQYHPDVQYSGQPMYQVRPGQQHDQQQYHH